MKYLKEKISLKGVQIYEKILGILMLVCFIGLAAAGSEQVVNKTAIDSLFDKSRIF